MRPFRVFAPQLVGFVLATGLIASGALLERYAVACGVLVAWGVGTGVVSFVTTLLKAGGIDGEDDWARLDKRGCPRCRDLRADLNETRRALLELRS